MRKYLIAFIVVASIGFSSCKEFGSCDQNDGAQTLDHGGETREYLVYVPPVYDGSSPVPVLLNFHGFGGNAQDFSGEADFRSLADANNFIVVNPQGACLEGFSHWNAGLDTPDNKSTTDDLGFVEALLNQLEVDYNIDVQRVYATGFSNGGMMAYALACYHNDLIAAAGSVSGVMLTETVDNCNAIHPTAIINIHGTSDDVLPYNGGDGHGSTQSTLDHWVAFNNTNSTPIMNSNNGIEEYAYLDGDSSVAVMHYKVLGGGHEWYNLEFNGSDTEQLIWEFVSQYDVNGLR